jgi:hypothetical protein
MRKHQTKVLIHVVEELRRDRVEGEQKVKKLNLD